MRAANTYRGAKRRAYIAERARVKKLNRVKRARMRLGAAFVERKQ